MEVSKFIIGQDTINIKDAVVRNNVASLQADLQAEHDERVLVDDGLNTRLLQAQTVKKTSKTFTGITINDGTTYTFEIPIPSGDNNAQPLYARSNDTTRSLIPINMYRNGSNFNVIMKAVGSSYTNINPSIEVTYSCDIN